MDSFTRYVRLRAWLERRYTKNGALVLSENDQPSRYAILESRAFTRYILGESYRKERVK